MSCTCHGASEEPCRYCQWADDHCEHCSKALSDCRCDWCSPCNDYAVNCMHGSKCTEYDCYLEADHIHITDEFRDMLALMIKQRTED